MNLVNIANNLAQIELPQNWLFLVDNVWGKVLGYFLKNLGFFFPNYLATLSLSLGFSF